MRAQGAAKGKKGTEPVTGCEERDNGVGTMGNVVGIMAGAETPQLEKLTTDSQRGSTGDLQGENPGPGWQ